MELNIESISTEWQADGQIDPLDVTGTAVNIPKMHNKYYKAYLEQNNLLRKSRANQKELLRLKTEYYKGEMHIDDLRKYNWEPLQLKILRQDLPHYIETDKDVIKLNLIIDKQQDLLQYLESIIKQINSMNYLLKTIVDFERFKAGG